MKNNNGVCVEGVFRRKGRGFTLVELLVVIGIIAVLISILLPVVNAARRASQQTACLANLRGISQAFLAHAAEKKNYLPLAGNLNLQLNNQQRRNDGVPQRLSDTARFKYAYARDDRGANVVWTVAPVHIALAPYMGMKLNYNTAADVQTLLNDSRGIVRRFSCPSVTEANSRPGALLRSPGSNNMRTWTAVGDFVFNEGVLGFDASRNQRRLQGNLSDLKRPAEVVLVTDGQRRVTAGNRNANAWLTWTPTQRTGRVTLGDAYRNTRATHSSQFDLNRHRKNVNVLYADGHAGTLKIAAADLDKALLLPE